MILGLYQTSGKIGVSCIARLIVSSAGRAISAVLLESADGKIGRKTGEVPLIPPACEGPENSGEGGARGCGEPAQVESNHCQITDSKERCIKSSCPQWRPERSPPQEVAHQHKRGHDAVLLEDDGRSPRDPGKDEPDVPLARSIRVYECIDRGQGAGYDLGLKLHNSSSEDEERKH